MYIPCFTKQEKKDTGIKCGNIKDIDPLVDLCKSGDNRRELPQKAKNRGSENAIDITRVLIVALGS